MSRGDDGRFQPADTDSFMKMFVEHGDVLEVDTSDGTEIVPCDVYRRWPGAVKNATIVEGTNPKWFAGLRQFCEGRPSMVTYRQGVWYGRYSAPGYMDATSWSWNPNRRKLEKELRELYGDGE